MQVFLQFRFGVSQGLGRTRAAERPWERGCVMYMLVSVVYLLISIMQEMTIYGIRTVYVMIVRLKLMEKLSNQGMCIAELKFFRINGPIPECAKHHGSLVTQQNFSTWRLYFSNEGRCWTHENCKKTFIIFTLIKVLTKSVRLVSYFYFVLGFYERVWLKYSTWRTKSLKRGRSSIRSSHEQIFEYFTT